MKRKSLLLSALLLLSPSAMAADLGWNGGDSGSIYSPVPASGWSGFYAGISAGYGWGNVLRKPTAGGAETSNGTSGFVLGGQLGYNLDLGGMVISTEADLQGSNLGYEEAIPGIGTFKTGMDYFGTLRGRAGMSFGQVMPYLTAGFAAGRGTASVTSPANVVTSQSANHLGWTVGLGMEAMATQNITFKAEYLYVDLGTQSYAGLPVGNSDITQRFSVIRGGVNYKF
ncbi:outer membrane protein [Devosia aquimaris]|uniref:outer membrane protein n=1 Tax=Devosia aquimaris TaxID=2866214 RepID=UPI001CD0B938|nr:outer membrane protein [Devosia sp. CJK-A8-3]